ncbi:hypothetical protein IQ270_15160 [Microcoleus sp. LEGE 07076]|nr:hypothetical protein [Microcoleus sp. LEGE 07076]
MQFATLCLLSIPESRSPKTASNDQLVNCLLSGPGVPSVRGAIALPEIQLRMLV